MWKTIKEEPQYEVSKDGRVRNKETGLEKSLRYDRYGYLRVTLYPSGKTYTVHRLVAMTFIKNSKNLPAINHKDGNKENNSVNNLEWCTNKHNTQHAMKLGLHNPREIILGSKNPSAVLCEELVWEIRYGKFKDLPVREVADLLSIRYETIRRAKKGDLWKHVTK